MSECTEDRFLKDVAEHEVTVIRNDGVNRHIRFRKPGTICYGFDLITWPGKLCITGDCGTYVFTRIEDMFEFFRTDKTWAERHPEQKLFINPGYWGEKLLSIGTNAGYKEFDSGRFTERVTDYFNRWKEDSEPTEDQAEELWDEIDSSVLSCIHDGEHAAYSAVYSFEHNDFEFNDFFDGGGTERYTFHYLWCLYAINWGISQYDALPKKQNNGNEKHITQVGELILHDGNTICDVVSDIHKTDNCGFNFMIKNPDTGQTYRADIKVQEI